MKNYVLGFAFSEDRQRVVLIRKNGNSVPAHEGKLNGVGGKCNPHEYLAEAMSREFMEEAGVDIPESRWGFKGQFSGAGWSVKVFSTFTDDIYKARTMEDEEVMVTNLVTIPFLKENSLLCHHVPLLVGLCLNDTIKKFSFEEE